VADALREVKYLTPPFVNPGTTTGPQACVGTGSIIIFTIKTVIDNVMNLSI
jgi:hypothetical protein